MAINAELTDRWQRISDHLVAALNEGPEDAFRASRKTFAIVRDGEAVIVLAVGILGRELIDTVRTRCPEAYVQVVPHVEHTAA